MSLEEDILEGTPYLVVGIIMPVKQRWADVIRASGPRQAEDLARVQVGQQVANGIHGELWVAGVFESEDANIKAADDYACFVDPDETNTGPSIEVSSGAGGHLFWKHRKES